MTLVDFIRLIVNNLRVLMAVPIVLAVTVFYLTRNEVKSYTSNTTIYTGLASGYTIEGSNKADFFNTAMAFDNLLNITKARETQEMVAIKLIARHLTLNKPDIRYISPASFDEFQTLFSPQLREKLRDTDSYERTVDNIIAFKESSDTNDIFNLLNSAHKYYSISAIAKTKIRREGNSDLISAEYSSEDQSICKYTLELLTEVFINKYKRIREDQTSTVVNYFVERLDEAFKRLSNAEDALLEFRTKNSIINYYEQTRFISSEKEKLDKDVNDEKITLAAAQASMNSVNKKLGSREKVILNSQAVMQKRHELVDISSDIALREIEHPDTIPNLYKTTGEVSRLKKQANSLKGELQQLVDNLYNANNSAVGLPLKDLLNRWVNSAIIIDESQAKLEVLQQRQADFAKIYKTMAPLGAEIKKIEREIDVSEQEYLALLTSLNQSKLKQQNVELSSDLKVIDAPFYPTKTKASARIIMVIVSGFGGFVFTLGIIVAVEFLDSTLKYPSRAEEQTGLTLAGAFPKLIAGARKVDINYINKRLIQQIVQNLKLDVKSTDATGRPYYVVFFSNRKGEGKTLLLQMVAKMLEKQRYTVARIVPAYENDYPFGTFQHNITYTIDNDFYELNAVDQLFGQTECEASDFDFVFIEMPPLLHYQYPIKMLENIHLSYLVIRSNRKWNKADDTTLATYREIVSQQPQVIINGVKIETLESIIGEIPKKRSWLRRTVKRWAKFEFRSRKNF
ncbi:hypothetical protein QQ020_06475 [Fulvivirgaceae bacterium BMA12]|uniref:Uncharacterized protein n=1 Tax=Agaribacillus aureus TaxID=3051825 RepID=A0ABT8L4F5_9BACT|nr:hypothetical protein [Fulvivirgaceae bacterium BMA12]